MSECIALVMRYITHCAWHNDHTLPTAGVKLFTSVISTPGRTCLLTNSTQRVANHDTVVLQAHYPSSYSNQPR